LIDDFRQDEIKQDLLRFYCAFGPRCQLTQVQRLTTERAQASVFESDDFFALTPMLRSSKRQ